MIDDLRANIKQSQHWEDFKKHIEEYRNEIDKVSSAESVDEFNARKMQINLINDFIAEIEQKDAFVSVQENDEKPITKYA